MKASLAILLIMAAGLSPGPAGAAGPGSAWYRVEVIVLTHDSGRPDDHPVTAIDDFRSLVDPLDRAVAAIAPAASDEAGEGSDPDRELDADDPRQTLELIDAIAALENPVPVEPDPEAGGTGPTWPQPYVNLPRLSPDMQTAWDRLTASPQFTPRAWRAWHQLIGRNERSQPMRIHDGHILRGDWLGIARAESTDAIDGPLPAPRAASLGSGWRPAPEYRLDGSIRIYHTQFMHAAANLAWREPLEPDRRPLASEHLTSGAFLRHHLEQSRTIRPLRLEYFDSSWLSVLVRVTPVRDDQQPGEPTGGN